MTLRNAVAAAALTVGLAGVSLATAGPALACGDAPGFCPNPPGASGQTQPVQTHTVSPDGTVGTSQDF